MSTADVVIITILCVFGFITMLSLLNRMASLEQDLWIEVLILVVVAFFIYLVARG